MVVLRGKIKIKLSLVFQSHFKQFEDDRFSKKNQNNMWMVLFFPLFTKIKIISFNENDFVLGVYI